MRIKEFEEANKPVNAMKQDILDNWLSAKKGSRKNLLGVHSFNTNYSISPRIMRNMNKKSLLKKIEKRMRELERKAILDEKRGKTTSEWYFKGKIDGLNEAWKLIKGD